MSTDNRAVLRSRLQYLLGDSEDIWTNAELNYLLEEAQQEVATRTLCVEATGNVSVTNGTREFTVPTGCIKVQAIFISGKGLLKCYPQQCGRESAGTPVRYYHHHDKIGFDPLSTSNVTAEVIYAKRPTAFSSDANTSDVPDQYVQHLLLWAEYQAWKKVGKGSRSAAAYNAYIGLAGADRVDKGEPERDVAEDARTPEKRIMQQGG